MSISQAAFGSKWLVAAIFLASATLLTALALLVRMRDIFLNWQTQVKNKSMSKYPHMPHVQKTMDSSQ